MIERVAAMIRRGRLLTPGQPVAAAVSGGADSLCLVLVLQSLGFPVSVAHVNHGMRGAESDADEAFVRAFAAERQLPYYSFSISVGPGNQEQNARRERYRVLETLITEGHCERVAVGHTRSDQAETVLFRLLRGAGTAGLSGIRAATRQGFVRPLLECSRAEVEEFLNERGVTWREDSTNRDEGLARNRIRHQLLPQLTREWNPSLAATLARSAQVAAAEEDYWEAQADDFEQRFGAADAHCFFCDADVLSEAHPALARRFIRRALERVRGDLRQIGFEHIEAVREIAASQNGHGRVILPGADVLRSFNRMRFSPIVKSSLESRNAAAECRVPGSVRLEGAASAFQFDLEAGDCRYNNEVANVLDWERCAGALELRNWLPGDRYSPVLCSGEDKPFSLKELFERDRIPLWERRSWPVLTGRGQILWTRRFGPAYGYQETLSTRTRLIVREKRQIAPGGESESGRKTSISMYGVDLEPEL